MRSIGSLLIILAIGAWQPSARAEKKASKRVDSASARANRTAAEGFAPEKDAGAAAPVVGHDFRIGPGDVLEIDVWKEPDASVPSATVRPDGKISFPFLKEIQVAGLTPLALEDLLNQKLRDNDYFRNPRVTVLVREINSQKIYVIGEVKKEGAIRLQSPMTVLQALAEAGGITDYAKKSKIQIFRIENQKQKIYNFDYNAVVHGQRVEQNFLVQPGDTIVVPR